MLRGNAGVNLLDGGAGRDVLVGRGGADDFLFAAGSSVDRVADFANGVDDLDLSAFGFGGFAEVRALARDSAAGLRIDFGDGDALIVSGFTRADFDAGDVIL